MTTPDTTDDGQAGTGGGATPPGSTTDTTGTGGAGSATPAPAGPAHQDFDTTTGGGADRNPADNPDYNENAPTPTPVTTVDTTDAGYDVDSTDDPAYRPPGPDAPASTTTTTNPGGNVVTVNPGSPDAAVVGGGDVNPNAVEPDPNATGPAQTGTTDTTGAGTNPNETFTPPGTIPAPVNVAASAVAGRRAAHVTWDAGPGTLAGMVDGWTVEGNTGGTRRVPANVRGVEMEEGLVGGQTYTFTVFGHNENGTGLRSAASNAVTIATGDIAEDPNGPRIEDSYDYASAPAAPAAPTAVAGVTSATVNWTAPVNDGGSPITGYTVTASTGQVQTVAGNVLTANFAGLTAGTPVTFTVVATNLTGSSPASAPSAAVTPTAA